MRKNFFKLAFLLVGFVAFFGFYQNTKAAEGDVNGVIISPPLTEKQAEPGSVYSDAVKVTNPNANADLIVTVSVEDFTAKGEEGQQSFIDPAENDSSYSLGKWLTVSEKSFTLKSNESKIVDYSISVPTNAEPGGHYGVIFFSPTLSSGAQTSSNSVLALPKIGSLILFTVPGEINYNGQITSFEAGHLNADVFTSKRLFIDSNNIVDYLTKFQNLSSTHVKPIGSIAVKNMFGKEVGTFLVNEKEGSVLPDSVRKFNSQSEIKHGFGLYNASVKLAYGEDKTATSSYSFWIIPWKETAGAIVLLVVLIWIIRNLSWKKKSTKDLKSNQ